MHRRTTRRKRTIRGGTTRGGNNAAIETQAKQLCSSSADCMELNNLLKKNKTSIKNPALLSAIARSLFDDFCNAALIDNTSVKKIGEESTNGVVLRLKFQKDNFKTTAIFKSSLQSHSDNLFYEYYVGTEFINKYLPIFPCFVETYSLCKFSSAELWKQFISAIQTKTQLPQLNEKNITFLCNIIKQVESKQQLWALSCTHAEQFAIFVQYFDNLVSFAEAYTTHHTAITTYQNMQLDVYGVLMQVYFPLTTLGKKYTHYDLHAKNVCLYKPFQGNQYIQMTYNFTKIGKRITFPSPFIVKLIDYGHCYFNNSDTDNTDYIIKNYICGNPICGQCGNTNGYYFTRGTYDIDQSSGKLTQNRDYMREDGVEYVSATVPHASHDLLFVGSPSFKKVFPNVFGQRTVYYEKQYGTKDACHINNHAHYIFNIYELIQEITKQLEQPNVILGLKQQYKTWTCAAHMQVYDDGRPYTMTLTEKNGITKLFNSLSS